MSNLSIGEVKELAQRAQSDFEIITYSLFPKLNLLIYTPYCSPKTSPQKEIIPFCLHKILNFFGCPNHFCNQTNLVLIT